MTISDSTFTPLGNATVDGAAVAGGGSATAPAFAAGEDGVARGGTAGLGAARRLAWGVVRCYLRPDLEKKSADHKLQSQHACFLHVNRKQKRRPSCGQHSRVWKLTKCVDMDRPDGPAWAAFRFHKHA